MYGSEFNKESLLTLKYELTLPELLAHKQFLEIQEDLSKEAHEENLKR